MITLKMYLGPHAGCPDLTPTRMENAVKLLAAVNALEVEMSRGGVNFADNPATRNGISGLTFGGFRPQNCPQGAPNSAHKEGNAVDRYDPDGKIDAWCLAHQDRLAAAGIWLEHPSSTVGWSHWARVPPKSGNRVFYP
jgi:hypothetical protein